MGHRQAKSEFIDLKVLSSTVPLRGLAIKVYRPVQPIPHFFASGRGNGDWTIMADLEATLQLEHWIALAADHPDAIVWIPKSGDRVKGEFCGFETCDLVLCHHSLQLNTSSWKTLRSYGRKGGVLQTISVKLRDANFEWPRFIRKVRRRPGQDVADMSLHSQTVFIVGSETLFRCLVDQCAYQQHSSVIGDHVHLSQLARHEPRDGQSSDLTVYYVPPEAWQSI